MSLHVKALQAALGIPADGILGPITERTILKAAQEGRLTVAGHQQPGLVPVAPLPAIINPPEADDIPASGDARLDGVHPVLADLIRAASQACDVPFTVIEGVRTAERQRQLVAKGASKTLNSRHLTGHAVDLWPLDANGKPLPAGTKAAEERLWADLHIIAATVKAEAARRGVMIEWGGDWGWDGPHFQLNRKAYP